MKYAIVLLVITLLAVAQGACTEATSLADNVPPAATAPETQSAPAGTATENIDDRTRKALIDAIADERLAQARYEAVIAKFGDVRPYSNIVNAEKRHESFLVPLFEKYGMAVPKNEYTKEKISVPATLAEACKESVKGEEYNIAMYDQFLEFVKESDIRQTFTYLRDASRNNHLPAFQRCGEGRGPGGGRGKRN